MSIFVKCPDCSKSLKVSAESVGKKVRCPSCSAIFPVSTTSDKIDDDIEVIEEYEAESPPRKDRPAEGLKKKPNPGKAVGPNWNLIGGLTGGGLLLLFAALFVSPTSQARKTALNREMDQANWVSFKHPESLAQIDMPAMPVFNPIQSSEGARTYTLMRPQFQMSLISIALPEAAQMAIASDPTESNVMWDEMERNAPQQMPDAKLISSRRFKDGAVSGLEMKLDIKGNKDLIRYYLYPTALLAAEFITIDEVKYQKDRERFFNSFRGPDGGQVNTNSNSASAEGELPKEISPAAGGSAKSLTEARRALRTQLIREEHNGDPVPEPPQNLAKKVSYDAPSGKLSAYVTTIPADGKKRPAIIWISGGDCNSIDDGFFKRSPSNNDQTASAFWKSGIVTMYPSLRGGNDNPGLKESFLGEIDDVLAAADFLSKQAGIDPERIYLGGHSTGGTVALLTAESTNPFRAIFSFGPVSDIRGYGPEFIFFDYKIPAELEPRTPAKWIDSIQNQTFVLEGMQQPGNAQSIQTMVKTSRNPKLSIHLVPLANHFNILAPVTQILAKKILNDVGPVTNITLTDGDLNLNYSE